MKKLLPFIVLLYSVIGFSQETLEKMELRDGKIFFGKVEKIKIDLVEFRDNETGLIYESAKKDIRYIQLATGKILTFEDYYQPIKKNETPPIQQTQQPVVVEKGNGNSALPIIILVGVLLVGVILIVAGP
jgi:hypothetical protein